MTVDGGRTTELLHLPPKDLARQAISEIANAEIELIDTSFHYKTMERALDTVVYLKAYQSLPAVSALLEKTGMNVRILDTQPHWGIEMRANIGYRVNFAPVPVRRGKEIGISLAKVEFTRDETVKNRNWPRNWDTEDEWVLRQRPVILDAEVLEDWEHSGDPRERKAVARLSNLRLDRIPQLLTRSISSQMELK